MSERAPDAVTSNESEPGKRALLGLLGAFAALTVVVVSVSLGARMMPRNDSQSRFSGPMDTSARPVQPETDPRIIAYLGPMATERQFEGRRITRIDPLQFGRMTLEIQSEGGDRFTIDIHAWSAEAPPPIAKTSKVALYLRTNNRGGQTPAAFVDICTALARALEGREAAGHAPPPLESLGARPK